MKKEKLMGEKKRKKNRLTGKERREKISRVGNYQNENQKEPFLFLEKGS